MLLQRWALKISMVFTKVDTLGIKQFPLLTICLWVFYCKSVVYVFIVNVFTLLLTYLNIN